MARSVHTTRRDVERAPKSERAGLRAELAKKRGAKRSVKEVRSDEAKPSRFAEVPIEVASRSRYVHYPASEADLRAILDALPGVADGLARIVLRATDAQSQREQQKPDPDATRAPWTKRYGFEWLPGVFAPLTLGRYSERTCVLALYGYTFDPERPDRPLVTSYLRLKMLETFVHELSHHRDAHSRRPQGRWAASTEKAERHAERHERAWGANVVVPYLEGTYVRESQALARWIATHLGRAVPLECLLDQPPKGLDPVVSEFEAAVWDAAQ